MQRQTWCPRPRLGTDNSQGRATWPPKSAIHLVMRQDQRQPGTQLPEAPEHVGGGRGGTRPHSAESGHRPLLPGNTSLSPGCFHPPRRPRFRRHLLRDKPAPAPSAAWRLTSFPARVSTRSAYAFTCLFRRPTHQARLGAGPGLRRARGGLALTGGRPAGTDPCGRGQRGHRGPRADAVGRGCSGLCVLHLHVPAGPRPLLPNQHEATGRPVQAESPQDMSRLVLRPRICSLILSPTNRPYEPQTLRDELARWGPEGRGAGSEPQSPPMPPPPPCLGAPGVLHVR